MSGDTLSLTTQAADEASATDHGVTYVKYATVLLQAMTVELDEDFLFALLDFSKFENASWQQAPQECVPAS